MPRSRTAERDGWEDGVGVLGSPGSGPSPVSARADLLPDLSFYLTLYLSNGDCFKKKSLKTSAGVKHCAQCYR